MRVGPHSCKNIKRRVEHNNMHSTLVRQQPPPASAVPRWKLPSEVDGWQVETARSLATQLAYKDLVEYLQRFLARREARVVDLFAGSPSVHVPVLYYDVRNQLKFTCGGISSTAAFVDSCSRALVLLTRTLQDVLACEHAFGETKWEVVAQVHRKLCSWLRQHHVERLLSVPRRFMPTTAGRTAPLEADASSSLTTTRTGTNMPVSMEVQAQFAPPGPLSPQQDDFAFTGWYPQASFEKVAQRAAEQLRASCQAESGQVVPPPVWVLAMGDPSKIWLNTLYFNNSDPTKIAAATGNTKIVVVRKACVQALASLWQATTAQRNAIRTWRQFHMLDFRATSAFVTALKARTVKAAKTATKGAIAASST